MTRLRSDSFYAIINRFPASGEYTLLLYSDSEESDSKGVGLWVANEKRCGGFTGGWIV